MGRNHIARVALAGAGLLLAGDAGAEGNAPAVSEPHALALVSVEAAGIQGTHAQVAVGGGGAFAPLADPFGVGVLVGVGAGNVEGNAREAVSGGAVLFWRRPDLGFVGAQATGTHFGHFDRFRAGVVGGLYRGPWDLAVSAGAAGGDGKDAGVFGADVGWYATEQLRLAAGGDVGTGRTYFGRGSIEWQPGDAASRTILRLLGGGGTTGGDGFYSVGAGLLWHFAAPKTLMRQRREDRL